MSCDLRSSAGLSSGASPFLILMYVNDISHNIHSQLQLFANDFLIYRTIHSSDVHHILNHPGLKPIAIYNVGFNITKWKIIQVIISYLCNKSNHWVVNFSAFKSFRLINSEDCDSLL